MAHTRQLRTHVADFHALDAGNSGTTARFLMGVLAGHAFTSTLTGDASLSRRPMRRVADPLLRMGARIETADGHLPVIVAGRAGGSFNPGRHVKLGGNTPMSNLYVRMLNEMGVKTDRFGDSTGKLATI